MFFLRTVAKFHCLCLLFALSVNCNANKQEDGIGQGKSTNYNGLVDVLVERLKYNTLKMEAVPMDVSINIEASRKADQEDRVATAIVLNSCTIFELDSLARSDRDVEGQEDAHAIHVRGQLITRPTSISCKLHFNYTQNYQDFSDHWKLKGVAIEGSVFNYDLNALLKTESLQITDFKRNRDVPFKYVIQAPRQLKERADRIGNKLPLLITPTINYFIENYLQDALETVTPPKQCDCYSTEKQKLIGVSGQ